MWIKTLLCQCVATQFEKFTHFENVIQNALNLGQRQRTLQNFSKCVINVHQHFLLLRQLTHFEKKITKYVLLSKLISFYSD